MLGLQIPPWILLGLGSFLVKRRRKKRPRRRWRRPCQLENRSRSSLANFGEDLGLTSTSSPRSVETMTKVQFVDASRVQAPPVGKSVGVGTLSPTNSREDLGLTSTSSPRSVETMTKTQSTDAQNWCRRSCGSDEALIPCQFGRFFPSYFI